MTPEARKPKSSAAKGAAGPAAQANGSGQPGADDDAAAGTDKVDEPLDLSLNALFNWGTDPRDAARDILEAQAEEALVVAERDEYLDALRRLQADFDNFRKRSLRQQTELLQRATEGLCIRLLPVLDALDLATAHVRSREDSSDDAKALEQIDSLLRAILAREGIERIDAVGVPFDPTIHDAVGSSPVAADATPADESGANETGAGDEAGDSSEAGDAAEEAEDTGSSRGGTGSSAGDSGNSAGGAGSSGGGPTVVQVMRAGYRLKSKVLRPAMVIVGG